MRMPYLEFPAAIESANVTVASNDTICPNTEKPTALSFATELRTVMDAGNWYTATTARPAQ